MIHRRPTRQVTLGDDRVVVLPVDAHDGHRLDPLAVDALVAVRDELRLHVGQQSPSQSPSSSPPTPTTEAAS